MLKQPVVLDVMTKDVVTVHPETSYKHVVELLTEHRISGMPVVDALGVVLGVVSEADLLHKEEFAGRTTSHARCSPRDGGGSPAGRRAVTPPVS